MNTDNALEIVYQKLLGEDSLPLNIRNMKGVDQDDYNQLINAINFLIDVYKNRTEIPKKLALAFVDIGNYFIVPNLSYSEKEIDLFEDYGMELSYLGQQLFND
jgi:hypothetical protein